MREDIAVFRRLIKASAIVIGVGLVTGCAVTPVKMGAAAIVGNQRITIATLDTEVTNLRQAVSQAAVQQPGVVNLNATQQTQATLSWLIRYQINEEVARQAGITISVAQAQAAFHDIISKAISGAEQQGLTNVTQALILAASGIPPDTAAELGRYEAIANEYLAIANGGTAPTQGSPADKAAGDKLGKAECLAAKALNIQVNPQFGQLDYTQYQVVTAPATVTRPEGPATSASPVATAPAC